MYSFKSRHTNEIPVVSILGRWRQGNYKFEVRLGYISTLSQKNKNKQKARKRGQEIYLLFKRIIIQKQ